MANEKMTKKDYISAIIAYLNGEDTTITKGDTTFEPTVESMTEFLEGEKALLIKKASNRKPTATQKANLDLKEKVYEIIKALGEKVSSADILKHVDCPAEITSTSKITALVGMLKAEGRVVSTTEKNRTFYSVVA
jgi:hypothetical protein